MITETSWGAKRPENVLLAAQFADIEPIGVDILDAAQFAAVDQFLELQNRRVIPEQVADHQDPAQAGGQFVQFGPVPLGEGERFLHVDILARHQPQANHSGMGHRRGGNGDAGHRRIVQRLLVGSETPATGVLVLKGLHGHGIGFADAVQGAQAGKIADQILTPVTGADHDNIGGVFFVHGYPCSMKIVFPAGTTPTGSRPDNSAGGSREVTSR